MENVDITIKKYGDMSVVKYTPKIEWRENCYLVVFKDNDCFIIDPGFNCEKVSSYIDEHGYVVKSILLTHAHHDHLACAEYLSRHFNISCLVDSEDKRLLMHAPMYSMRFAGKLVERPSNVVWLDKDVEQELLEKYGIRTVHAPGHTPGGVCFVCRDSIFSGDTIVRGYMGRTDLPGSDRKQLIHSITDLLKNESFSDDIDLYPGHGESWTIGEARKWWQAGGCLEKKSF